MTSPTEQAIELMLGFGERTGLSAGATQKRYLWTDAFALCNYLALARRTGDAKFEQLALKLVDSVHHVLGRHRSDDTRKGWLATPAGQGSEEHPTRGGLRIGKPLPERQPGEAIDEVLEWDRDGQYFHYLTKWMHALDQASRWLGRRRLNAWARELADTAHRSFVRGQRMSIDLSRPLVPSMGQHDPLDALITTLELEATPTLSPSAEGPSLKQAVADFQRLTARSELLTADPLGLGGLLFDACRVDQLLVQKAMPSGALRELRDQLLPAASQGLAYYLARGELGQPAARRLAFRELGLAIGLGGAKWLAQQGSARFAALAPYFPLRDAIRSFWLAAEPRQTTTFAEHRDINEVMLATSLVPEGFLAFRPL